MISKLLEFKFLYIFKTKKLYFIDKIISFITLFHLEKCDNIEDH
jgi:hypothetical protein